MNRRRWGTAAKVVAIHQPNFFPWLGFFDKLARADVFVLLDDVQFPRTGKGTWVNRVQLLVSGKPAWVTAPIVRAEGSSREIREVRVDDSQPWRTKLLRTVEHNYRRTPHYGDVFPLVEELVTTGTDRLAELNERNVRRIAAEVGLDADKIVRSSSIETEGHSTDLLIELTKAVGGTAYLAGAGAAGYQEDEKFAQAGLELVRQDFRHPTYPQPTDEPVHGLSIVDALFNCGLAGTGDLVRRTASAGSPVP